MLAFLKSQPIGFYSLSMGVNFGIVSASFFSELTRARRTPRFAGVCVR